MNPVRGLLLKASTNPFLAQRLPRMGFVRRAVRRFMPGEEPGDALAEAKVLADRGAGSILTLLGENVTTQEAAGAVVDHYLAVLEDLRGRRLDAELSVKPTQLGLDLGQEVATRNLRRLVEDAAGDSSMVWIDMESSAYVDPTLALFRTLREEHDNVGVCLQAYLHRTPADLEALLPLRPAIRLVKGAYREPPEVAIAAKSGVDAAYLALAGRLLEARAAGTAGRPGIATHDARILQEVAARADALGLGRDRWEFELLYGIGTREQDWALDRGYRLRVLVSYGSHWFPWYMRRLAERPANLWFVARKLVGA